MPSLNVDQTTEKEMSMNNRKIVLFLNELRGKKVIEKNDLEYLEEIIEFLLHENVISVDKIQELLSSYRAKTGHTVSLIINEAGEAKLVDEKNRTYPRGAAPSFSALILHIYKIVNDVWEN